MNAEVHHDLGCLVGQVPTGLILSVRGVVVLGYKVPLVGMPESEGEMILLRVVPVGE